MNAPTTFTITLTEQAMNVVAAALGELPLKTSAPVFADIQQQVAAQQQSRATKVDEPADSSTAQSTP